jgi:hypothetical protein
MGTRREFMELLSQIPSPTIAIVGIIVVALVIAILKGKKRTKDMEAVSNELGFTFTPKGERSIFSELSGLPLFSQGHSRRVRNVLEGKDSGGPVTIFDYRYTVGGGKHSHTYRQTIIYFRSDTLTLPGFALRPESIFHRIGSALGYQDIDFETNPEFSRRYLLRGVDETAIRNLFTLEVLTYFETEKAGKVCVEGNGKHLICYKAAKLIKPDDIRTELEEAKSILELFGRS